MERILVYGGAFDPPHAGHERLLRTAIEQIKPDLTLVIPTGRPPHKGGPSAPFAARAHMARVFLDCGGKIKISGLENRTGHRKNYTVGTLKRLKKRYPGAKFYILIGGDMLLTFTRWKQYKRILGMATLVAAGRGEENASLAAAKRGIEQLGGQVNLLEFKPLVVSSTAVRKKLAQGEPCVGLISDTVAQVVAKWGLYR